MKTHGIVLDGNEVRLRPMTDTDLPIARGWWNDPEIAEWSDDNEEGRPYSPEEIREIYARLSNEGFVFVIEEGGTSIGDCWLQRMNLKYFLDRFRGRKLWRIDIQIGDPQKWNKGIGTETIGLLTNLGFSREAADAVFGCSVGNDNPRSFRAFRKNGYWAMEEPGGDVHLMTLRELHSPSAGPSEGISVVNAQPKDAETITRIVEQVGRWLTSRNIKQWSSSPREGRTAGQIRTGLDRGEWFLALADGNPFGTFRLTWGTDFDRRLWRDIGGEAAYLHKLAVLRSHAGRSLGLALLRWAERLAGCLGLPLRLDCWSDNARLLKYYDNAGYARKGAVQIDEWNLVRYERPIS